MNRHLRKLLARVAFAALTGLGLHGSAQAILVVGVFDPLFGPDLPGVSYAGTAQFSVSQACLDLNLPSFGLFIPAAFNCGGSSSGMGFLGAHVDFTGAQTGTVDFLADPNAILGMYIQNHQVIGVQSRLIGPATSTLPGNEKFDLLFGLLLPPVGNIFTSFDGDLGDILSAPFKTTSLFLIEGGCTPGGRSNPCTQSNPASTSFAVPEPASLALVLVALGAGGLGGLRKRRAAAPRLA